MTPEQQRIAIAEATGWKFHYSDDGFAFNKDHPLCEDKMYHRPPNYPNDLNAMHEVEKGLTVEQKEIYIGWLWQITKTQFEADEYRAYFVLVAATALQRSEAYLKTRGLWKD